MEVLYLTVNDPQAASAKAIRDRMAQQGKGLESVVGLLEDHAADSPLLPGLRRLQMLYGDVGMEYTFQEPVTDTKARTTYINSVTTVDLTDDQLQAITEAVNDLRAQITPDPMKRSFLLLSGLAIMVFSNTLLAQDICGEMRRSL